MEVTKRQTLLECLDIMQKFRAAFSTRGMGLAPIERYQALFIEYDEKCRILREMIQALESEPVRRAMADWQKVVMEQGPTVLRMDEGEDAGPINGPLGKSAQEGR